MNLFLKRLADITLASVISILIMPFFVVISIAIKFDSKGPVFFKQNRRTKDGKIFQMLKFRSMIQNAENIGTGLFNYQNDPRVTTFGAFCEKQVLMNFLNC
jgi:lipopolysaccharide/colanic/teichoic acid biosynthesis glycosyltransferase